MTGRSGEADPVWHRLELNQQGLDDAAIVRQCRSGALERVRRGVYDDAAGDATPEQRHRRLILATVPLLAPGSVLSHHSAGVLHELPVERDHLERVAVTRLGTTSGTRASSVVQVHRRAAVRSVIVDGLPVTPMADTAVDLACPPGFLNAVSVMDAALHRGADRTTIERALTEARRVGNPQARQALWAADGRSESVGESHSRILMAQLGIPTPALQLELADAQGIVRVDFAWPGARVVGEFDGRIKYGRLLKPGQRVEDVMAAERAREVRLEQLGWMVVRWVWADLQHPKRLAAKLRLALHRPAA